MADRTKAAQSTMAFSCIPALTSGIVPSVIAEFEQKVPHVRVVVYDEIGAELIQHVFSGKAEFSISTFKHDPELIEHAPLAQSFISVICHCDSDLASKESVTWKDLLDQRVINLFRGESVQELIAKIFPIDGRHFEAAYEIGYIQTALAMAAQHLGVLVLPDYFVVNNPHFGSLVARKLHTPEVEQRMYVHTRKGHVLSEAAQVFLELLRHRLESSGPTRS
jgi:DNA-binding transcriptional LysR family regulator